MVYRRNSIHVDDNVCFTLCELLSKKFLSNFLSTFMHETWNSTTIIDVNISSFQRSISHLTRLEYDLIIIILKRDIFSRQVRITNIVLTNEKNRPLSCID
jgi:hypothetical protein